MSFAVIVKTALVAGAGVGWRDYLAMEKSKKNCPRRNQGVWFAGGLSQGKSRGQHDQRVSQGGYSLFATQ